MSLTEGMTHLASSNLLGFLLFQQQLVRQHLGSIPRSALDLLSDHLQCRIGDVHGEIDAGNLLQCGRMHNEVGEHQQGISCFGASKAHAMAVQDLSEDRKLGSFEWVQPACLCHSR